jgi:hypothetical protein
MPIKKVLKDKLTRVFLGEASIPRGLFELSEYFRHNGNIHFDFHHEDGIIVAISTNFRHGKIITQGRNLEELDKNIRDAILTAFEIPSSYAEEAQVTKLGEAREYALA